MSNIKVLDLEFIENFDEIVSGKFIIYGTSSKAEELWSIIEKVGLNIVACCDGAEQKIGTLWNSYTIESFDEVCSRMPLSDVIVLICSSFVKEIIENIEKKCENIKGSITELGFQYGFLLNRNSKVINEKFKKWYTENWEFWLRYRKKTYVNEIQRDYYDKLIQFKCTNPILVYSAGKVGSASIAKSIGYNSLHIHNFLPSFNCLEDTNDRRELLRGIINEKEKIKIITMVRDPIARDLSGAFQSLADPSRWMYRNLSNDFCESILDIMKESFYGENSTCYVEDDKLWKNNYDIRKGNIGWLFNWFNIELNEIFGINVFEYPFDKEKGYSVIVKGNVECLVIKLEKLEDCCDIIGRFVGLENFELKKINFGHEKPYFGLYKSVKEQIRIPSEMINFYYEGKYIQHFYTEKEITSFRDKWEK